MLPFGTQLSFCEKPKPMEGPRELLHSTVAAKPSLQAIAAYVPYIWVKKTSDDGTASH